MGDKVRGALSSIDWSKPNQTSININRRKETAHQPSTNTSRNQSATQQQKDNNADREPLPFNPYPSVVAPVKSGKTEDPPNRKPTTSSGYGSAPVPSKDDPEDIHMYLGFIGSVRVDAKTPATGIAAIQSPMRDLYFPYRTQEILAQERVLYLCREGIEVFYLDDPRDEEPSSFMISWDDILYVEPLKFSTKIHKKDKKIMRAAFEPCETQRLMMLGDPDPLFTPIHKKYKHVALMKHPALFCMVVRNPQAINELFVHGFICSTVEESVLLARRVREELEAMYFLRANQQRTPIEKTLTASTLSLAANKYSIQQLNNTAQGFKESKQVKEKSKDKKKKGQYTTHTGNEEEDFGSFHFGMTADGNQSAGPPGRTRQTSRASYSSYESAETDNSREINDNFAIGKQGLLRSGARNQSRHSLYSEIDQLDYYTPASPKASDNRLSSYDGKPVGVVSPQATSFRDAFRVLPSAATDKSLLRPTPLSARPKSYNEVTPELEQKLKSRQHSDSSLLPDPLAPRDVVNPLADPLLESNSTFFDKPGPLFKMKHSLPFHPPPALPETSSWHESVISNYKSKEKIENRLESQTVDAKELPKLESEKKEQEIASMFANFSINKEPEPDYNANAITGLHAALGFMP